MSTEAGAQAVDSRSGKYLLRLSFTALGVVYGDIGTSPLYAIRECFGGTHPVESSIDNVFGVISTVFWALIAVISVKYAIFVLRADNRGEGGILALMALVRGERSAPRRSLLVGIGVFGAALLYSDGMITPAISVLSAVEGLNLASPIFNNLVIPIALLLLIGLFVVQRYGTDRVGKAFAPVTLLWFLVIATIGFVQIVKEPGILRAVNPIYCLRFFETNGMQGFLVLGAVFLVVTGGEALYADMGHFGPRAIRLAWYGIVLPSLLLNYFGQGAFLLHHPQSIEHLFYLMVPSWALYPVILLATAATVIASQAVISGAFSLSKQAIQLGYSPRLKIVHTSDKEIGQIYVPGVNSILMLSTILLVLTFGSSSNLAAAYGVAVTTTMVITTILLYVVARRRWKWHPVQAIVLTLVFLVIDLAFWWANMVKLPHGGWVPLVIAGAGFLLMMTWRKGRLVLEKKFETDALPTDLFLDSLQKDPPLRIHGTAVFMARTRESTPHALLHNLKHNHVLHESVIFLTVLTEDFPYYQGDSRVEIRHRENGIYQATLRYGFMEVPNIPEALKEIDLPGLNLQPDWTTFYLGRESLIVTGKSIMSRWRARLFAWMSRNALNAAQFFELPPNRVIEIGAQIEM